MLSFPNKTIGWRIEQVWFCFRIMYYYLNPYRYTIEWRDQQQGLNAGSRISTSARLAHLAQSVHIIIDMLVLKDKRVNIVSNKIKESYREESDKNFFVQLAKKF